MSAEHEEHERFIKASAAYIFALEAAAMQIAGLPIALVVSTPTGEKVIVASDFPNDLLPSRERWMEMYPGDRNLIGAKKEVVMVIVGKDQ